MSTPDPAADTARASPAGRHRLRSHPHAPLAVLAAAVALWAVVFGVLVYRRHARFGSFGFDLGIYDQAIWVLAHGGQFITVRGLPTFGHHATVSLYALTPFYLLGTGPQFIDLLQVASLASAPVALYLLARHRLGRPWLALGPALAFLLHPATQFLAWELFHPETLAVAPLLFGYLAGVHRRWGWYAGLLAFAVLCKEDVALAAAVVGLIVALRGDRRIGVATIVMSLGWYFFTTRVLLGAFNGIGPFYDQFYGDLGGSPLGVARTAVRHPTAVLRRLFAGDSLAFLLKMAAPFGFLALAAPLVLAVGLPQLVADLLSMNDFTRKITFHYAALPLAALALATVEALPRVARTTVERRVVVIALVNAAFLGTLAWGPSPVGAEFRRGYWPGADPARPTMRAAVARVRDGAPVSATYDLVAHLSHRWEIYEFPNPWIEQNWGVRGERTRDPARVRWLVLDRRTFGAREAALADRLLASGEFVTRLDRDGIVVAERVGRQR